MQYDINEATLQQFSEQKILDEDDNFVIISSLWKDQKTVIVFLRHFG